MNRDYRKTYIIGNWKMNKTPTETKLYMYELKRLLPKGRWCDIALCVPSICIDTAVRVMHETRVGIGAENCNANKAGAYTGEISCNMLVDADCKYVILGHSERRLLGETDADINAKVLAALNAGLIPVFCCGETKEQRDDGISEECISIQLKLGLKGVDEERLRKVVIVYDPIWAIKDESAVTPEQIETTCEYIRTTIRKIYSARRARSVSILYSGMNEKNAYDLLTHQNIDGGLIGDDSLKPESFVKIINAANQPKY